MLRNKLARLLEVLEALDNSGYYDTEEVERLEAEKAVLMKELREVVWPNDKNK